MTPALNTHWDYLDQETLLMNKYTPEQVSGPIDEEVFRIVREVIYDHLQCEEEFPELELEHHLFDDLWAEHASIYFMEFDLRQRTGQEKRFAHPPRR